MTTLAERLKLARTLKGPIWTQTHLAVAAGVSKATVAMIESGARQSKGSIPELAKALGVRYEWLLTGDGEMYPPEANPAPLTQDDELLRELSNIAALLAHIPRDRWKEATHDAVQALIAHLPKTLPLPTARPGLLGLQ